VLKDSGSWQQEKTGSYLFSFQSAFFHSPFFDPAQILLHVSQQSASPLSEWTYSVRADCTGTLYLDFEKVLSAGIWQNLCGVLEADYQIFFAYARKFGRLRRKIHPPREIRKFYLMGRMYSEIILKVIVLRFRPQHEIVVLL
jgi:hypothetical protein